MQRLTFAVCRSSFDHVFSYINLCLLLLLLLFFVQPEWAYIRRVRTWTVSENSIKTNAFILLILALSLASAAEARAKQHETETLCICFQYSSSMNFIAIPARIELFPLRATFLLGFNLFLFFFEFLRCLAGIFLAFLYNLFFILLFCCEMFCFDVLVLLCVSFLYFVLTAFGLFFAPSLC